MLTASGTLVVVVVWVRLFSIGISLVTIWFVRVALQCGRSVDSPIETLGPLCIVFGP